MDFKRRCLKDKRKNNQNISGKIFEKCRVLFRKVDLNRDRDLLLFPLFETSKIFKRIYPVFAQVMFQSFLDTAF